MIETEAATITLLKNYHYYLGHNSILARRIRISREKKISFIHLLSTDLSLQSIEETLIEFENFPKIFFTPSLKLVESRGGQSAKNEMKNNLNKLDDDTRLLD